MGFLPTKELCNGIAQWQPLCDYGQFGVKDIVQPFQNQIDKFEGMIA